MHVGAELAAARSARGLSLDQIAARTKVSVERLDAIERQDVEQLPPRVYLLGFVRAYASEVGLHPDAVAERYIAQFAGATVIERARGGLEDFSSEDESDDAVAPPVAAPAPNPPAEAPPRVAVNSEPPWRPAQFDTPPAPPQTPPALPLRLDAEPDDPYASWRPRVTLLRPVERPPMIRLRTLLIATVIAVAAGIAFSASLYNARREGPSSGLDSGTGSEAGESSDRRPQRDISPTAPASADAAAERVVPDRAAARDDTPDEATVAARPPASPSGVDIGGQWSLTTHVDSSAYTRYNGLTLGYALELHQRGNRVTGSGRKISENGRGLPPASQTPITLEGTINGDRLDLTFTERGRHRTSGGSLVLAIGADGSLRGNFSSDAAQSRGTSAATRVSATTPSDSRQREN